MNKCGCKIVVVPESGSMLGGPLTQKMVQDIKYCPLHAAAAQLQVSLEHCIQSMSAAQYSTFGCLPEARTALAASRGE